jgi:hypothetical protein
MQRLIKKNKKKFIFKPLESCDICTFSFDLWMSRKRMDTFVLIIHFLNHNWEFGHVTIGLFETTTTSRSAMVMSRAQKKPTLQDFLTKTKTSRPSFKSKSWNKINKNTTHAKQESKKILLKIKKQKQNKIMTRNIPKTGIEHIKGNEEFYLYLYPLGT